MGTITLVHFVSLNFLTVCQQRKSNIEYNIIDHHGGPYYSKL